MTNLHTPPGPGEPPLPGTGALLRRLIAPFFVALTTLTALLLINQINKMLPYLWGRGVPSSEFIEIFVLSLPFILALTLPAAVFAAVMWVCIRLPADREITVTDSRGLSLVRLLAPILGAAACVGVLTLAWNAEILPHSNHRLRDLLAAVQNGNARAGSDSISSERDMTIGELRAGIRAARGSTDRVERTRATAYEVEVQKKYAISGACLVFAWLAAPLGLLLRGSGWGPVIGVSIILYAVYYIGLIVGEALADRMITSPFFGMWAVNLSLGIVGLAALVWLLVISHDVARA